MDKFFDLMDRESYLFFLPQGIHFLLYCPDLFL